MNFSDITVAFITFIWHQIVSGKGLVYCAVSNLGVSHACGWGQCYSLFILSYSWMYAILINLVKCSTSFDSAVK